MAGGLGFPEVQSQVFFWKDKKWLGTGGGWSCDFL